MKRHSSEGRDPLASLVEGANENLDEPYAPSGEKTVRAARSSLTIVAALLFLSVLVAVPFFLWETSGFSASPTASLDSREDGHELRKEIDLLKTRVRDLEDIVHSGAVGFNSAPSSSNEQKSIQNNRGPGDVHPVAGNFALSSSNERKSMQGKQNREDTLNPLDEGSENQAIIVAGSLYSGATLIAEMLGAHMEVCRAGGPDGIDFDSRGSDQVAGAERACAGQTWVATTTLSHRTLENVFKILPGARVVLLYRRGTEAVFDYVDAMCDVPGCSDAEEAQHVKKGAELWKDANLEAIRWVGDSRVLFLQYEQAVSAPTITLHTLAAFLTIPGNQFGSDAKQLASSAAAAILDRSSHAARAAKHAAAFSDTVGDIPTRLGYGNGYSEELKSSWPQSKHVHKIRSAGSSSTEQGGRYRTTDDECTGPPIVVAGCGHSGTTLLVKLIGAHPVVYEVPGETKQFTLAGNVNKVAHADENFARKCSRVRDKQRVGRKKDRWVEKTAKNVAKIKLILLGIPTAKVVVIYRDGRDVVMSLMERACEEAGLCNRTSLEGVAAGAQRWFQDNTAALSHLNNHRVHFMQFEQLVRAPFLSLHNLCNFLQLSFEPMDMLSYHEDDLFDSHNRRHKMGGRSEHQVIRAEQMRTPLYFAEGKGSNMTEAENALFEERDGELYTVLGYRTFKDWRRRR